ncbi:MAG: hypothetical protein DMF78_03965 [Acidobacteria bacterium]|nr:MAG: hypothetical protein DMF78_03965 [Acidobacteriota bacterium]
MADASFEYDEDTEAGDEGIEADESVEAAGDEGFEADEDVGEADEGADEGVEAVGDMEGIDEADGEADEAIDEAVDVSASARLRADQDRNRREEWARQIAADQRLEAQRAATTQRSITERLRSIQVQGSARISTVGSLRGAGVVTAVLPNGRRSQMRIIPTLAPVGEVNRLRSVVISNERRQAVATRYNARAIASLSAAQVSAVKKLTDQQVKSDKDLSKRIVQGDNRLDRRISKELSGGTGILDKHSKRMMRVLRRHRQRSLWNGVLLATSAPFFAAYGDPENPFSRNNLILTGSLLGWLTLDELVDSFSGKSSVMKGGATLWSYLAPVGNGATAYFLLRNKQHTRFLAGVNEIADPATSVKIPLTTGAIAKSSVDDFNNQKHVAVVTAVSGTGAKPTTVFAEVANGMVTLTIDPAPGAGKKTTLAWMVDTRPAAAIPPAP